MIIITCNKYVKESLTVIIMYSGLHLFENMVAENLKFGQTFQKDLAGEAWKYWIRLSQYMVNEYQWLLCRHSC